MIDPHDAGLARERTALAWTRSALNMAASGTLIARAAFAAHLDALAITTASVMATMAFLTWRHGQQLGTDAVVVPPPQRHALAALTAATVVTAVVATVVTVAL